MFFFWLESTTRPTIDLSYQDRIPNNNLIVSGSGIPLTMKLIYVGSHASSGYQK